MCVCVCVCACVWVCVCVWAGGGGDNVFKFLGGNLNQGEFENVTPGATAPLDNYPGDNCPGAQYYCPVSPYRAIGE